MMESVAVQADGGVLFIESRDDGVFLRRLTPDGHLYTVLGGGTDASESPDGALALGASLPSGIRGMTVGPDGLVYFTTAVQVRDYDVRAPDVYLDGKAGEGAGLAVGKAGEPADRDRLKIWFGESPADMQLRDGLLGLE